jgi:hypothetical protein
MPVWTSNYPPLWEDDVCNPLLTIRWRDHSWSTAMPVGGILGGVDDPEWCKRLTEEREEAQREELRTLYGNVVLLDDYRR